MEKMNLKISKSNKPLRSSNSKGSRDKSTLRPTSSLNSNSMQRSELNGKKPRGMEGNVEKSSLNSLKTPKPSLAKSTSFNLSSCVAKTETKKPGSKIPRSKSRVRTENEVLKIEPTLKADEIKDVYKPKKKVEENRTEDSLKQIQMGEEKKSEPTSLLSKSSEYIDTQANSSVSLYKDAEEEIIQEILIEERANEDLLRMMLSGEEKMDEERESEMQEKIIKNLYETAKHTKEPLFENFKWTDRKIVGKGRPEVPRGRRSPISARSENSEASEIREPNKNFSSIQEHYNTTIQEITQVWKNTVSVIDCVKDHTIKYVEEKSGKIDKEQLTLEAEMLQLAVDFAISYSKLKMDFLLKGVKKQLEVREVEKSELETFLDSKTFAAMYNEEDLAAMAQTVRELNTSILKGEDIDLV